MTTTSRSTKLVALATCLGLGLLVGAGIMTMAGNQQTENSRQLVLPESIPLEAGTSSVGKNISMATGPVDEDVEGLFVLDHLTGTLSLIVVNPRGMGGPVPIIGQFTANVTSDLGLEKGKETDYVMTVGGVSALRGGGPRPAQCVVYVADGNTGNVVGYSLTWDKTAANSSRPQGGALIRVMVAKARPNILEE